MTTTFRHTGLVPAGGFSIDKLGLVGKIQVKANDAVLLIFPARWAASLGVHYGSI